MLLNYNNYIITHNDQYIVFGKTIIARKKPRKVLQSTVLLSILSRCMSFSNALTTLTTSHSSLHDPGQEPHKDIIKID